MTTASKPSMLSRMSRDENLAAPSRGIASLTPARPAAAARALLPAVDAGILAIDLDDRRLDAVLKPGLANLFRLYRKAPCRGTLPYIVAELGRDADPFILLFAPHAIDHGVRQPFLLIDAMLEETVLATTETDRAHWISPRLQSALPYVRALTIYLC